MLSFSNALIHSHTVTHIVHLQGPHCRSDEMKTVQTRPLNDVLIPCNGSRLSLHGPHFKCSKISVSASLKALLLVTSNQILWFFFYIKSILTIVVCWCSPQALSTLDSVSLMYPFFYRPMFEVIEDGWNSFLPEDAFKDLESMVGALFMIILFFP